MPTTGYGDPGDTGDTDTEGGNPDTCFPHEAPAEAVRWQCEGFAEAALHFTVSEDAEIPDAVPDDWRDYIQGIIDYGRLDWYELFGPVNGETYDEPGIDACCLPGIGGADTQEASDDTGEPPPGEDPWVPQPAMACADDCADQACRQAIREIRTQAEMIPGIVEVSGASLRDQLIEISNFLATGQPCFDAMTAGGVSEGGGGWQISGTVVLPTPDGRWPAFAEVSVRGDCTIYDWYMPEQGEPDTCTGINDNNGEDPFGSGGPGGSGFGGFDTFAPVRGKLDLDGPTILGIHAAGSAPILGLGDACPRGECSRVDAWISSETLELERMVLSAQSGSHTSAAVTRLVATAAMHWRTWSRGVLPSLDPPGLRRRRTLRESSSPRPVFSRERRRPLARARRVFPSGIVGRAARPSVPDGLTRMVASAMLARPMISAPWTRAPAKLRPPLVAGLGLAAVLGCTPEELPLPPVVWEGEMVRARMDDPGIQVCGGTFEALDRHAVLVREALLLEGDGVIEYSIGDQGFVDASCTAAPVDTFIACTSRPEGHVFTTVPFHRHEIVHATRILDPSISRRSSIFEEGLATMFGDDDLGNGVGPLRVRELFEDAHVGGGIEYFGAGHAMANLLELQGVGAFRRFDELARTTNEDAAFIEAFGETKEEFADVAETMPICEQSQWWMPLVECDGEPLTADPETRQLTLSGNVSCGEPDVKGPADGRMWTSRRFRLDSPTTRWSYDFDMPEDATLEIVSCQGGCPQRFAYIGVKYEIWSYGDNALDDLEPGEYFLRMSRPVADDDGYFEVVIDPT